MSTKHISRRNFIGQASCLAVGTTTIFNSLLNLGMANALSGLASGADDDYRALVCILLSGGNDSYNMLIPTSNADYQEYQASRSNLAIPQNNILGINPMTSDGRTFGIHPAMPELHSLFENGNAALISNVGTLIEPIMKSDFENNFSKIPLGLLSHSDQAMQWMTSFPQDRSSIGWGGKMADLLIDANNNDSISMNISLSGNNIFQKGNNTIEYSINSQEGGRGIIGYGDSGLFNQLKTAGINSMLNQQYHNVFKKSYANIVSNAQESNQEFNEAISQVAPFTTQFSQNYVSQSLQMIARTIAARETLGMKKQTFFLTFGGWDHHDELLSNQNEMLAMLSSALGEFQSAMEELATQDEVTTFTISDFARTLTSNGNGTDHAWGGNAIVMGGAVKGKEIYGTYPSLALNNDLEVGNGILIPTTSTDEYFAELALWFGVPKSDLGTILPNIGNFYSTQSTENPLGFMNI